MTKPCVMWDLDGVLCDYVTPFCAYSRRVLGKPRKGQEPPITDFHFDKCGYWSKTEVDRIINFTKGERNFWESLPRLPGTSRLTKDASELNSFFVTARYTTEGHPTDSQSAEWLYRNFGIRDAYVIVDANKGKQAESISPEWAIDDRIENTVNILEAVPTCRVFILDQLWNRNFTHERIQRVSSVNDFLKIILDE